MVEIGSIAYTEKFQRDVRKVRNSSLRTRLEKQIAKVAENPEFGKPLRYGLKGEWTIRIKPYRLIYAVRGDQLILLRFEHRGEVYE